MALVPLSTQHCTLSTGLQSRTAWTPSLTKFFWPSLLGFCLKTLFQKIKCCPWLGSSGNWTPTHHLSPYIPALPYPLLSPFIQKNESLSLSSCGWLAFSVSTGPSSTQVWPTPPGYIWFSKILNKGIGEILNFGTIIANNDFVYGRVFQCILLQWFVIMTHT